VGAVSRFNSNYGLSHWKAVKRVLRYLKGTKHYTLEYKRGAGDIRGFCDADWANDINDRRSVTGYVFTLNGGAISWNSKKQPTVALSTSEAEYMALGQAAKEGIWLKTLLKDLRFDSQNNHPILIFSDSQSAIALSKNAVHHARTKHIDIRHHFIRETIEPKQVEIEFCGTNDMIADTLTKSLTRQKHNICVTSMGLTG
jgi:hypothetical protein